MSSRIRCALLALSFCASLVGCADGYHVGDWLWWPSLTPITSYYVDQIPVHDVALEVQCEIYQFLSDPTNQNLLDPDKGAGVVLTLQTDLSGSVTYTGINLAKLGAPSLAELVTLSNKVPTLQAKGNGQASVSAEVDFTVAQTVHGWAAKGPTPPKMIIKQSDFKDKDPKTGEPTNTIWENVKFTPTPPDEKNWDKNELHATKEPLTSTPKVALQPAKCGEWYRTPWNLYLKLSLDDWLQRYSAYSNHQSNRTDEPFVCGTKITLRSSFKILFDVSAGVNAFMAPPIILPISGFSVDASPDYMHSIAVTFQLKDSTSNSAYCKKLGAGAQPSVK